MESKWNVLPSCTEAGALTAAQGRSRSLSLLSERMALAALYYRFSTTTHLLTLSEGECIGRGSTCPRINSCPGCEYKTGVLSEMGTHLKSGYDVLPDPPQIKKT